MKCGKSIASAEGNPSNQFLIAHVNNPMIVVLASSAQAQRTLEPAPWRAGALAGSCAIKA
jgi:hypothetical protein